jgi:putative ABC transport system permease protein
LLERLRQVPGVEAVGATTQLFDLGDASESDVAIEGSLLSVHERPMAVRALATPEFLEMSGRRLLEGRFFGGENDAGGAGAQRAVVNSAFARAVSPDRSIVGRRVRLSALGTDWLEVVGVVSDLAPVDRVSTEPPWLYFDYRHAPADRFIVVGRFAPGSVPTASTLHRIVRELDPAVPVMRVQTVQDVLHGLQTPRRVSGLVVASFTIVALVLACTGLYGVVAFESIRRRKECSIRLALGATHADIVALVSRAGLTPVVGGLVAGAAGSVVAERLAHGFLFDASGSGWFLTLVVQMALLGAAGLACMLAAAGVRRLDAASALRES